MTVAFWLLGLAVAVFVCQLIYRLFKFAKYAAKVNKLPGPKGVPIFGKAWEFFFIPHEDAVDKFLKILREQQDLGHSLISTWIGNSAKIFIFKGSAIEPVLKSNIYLNKSCEYNFAKGFLKDGLLCSKKELWEKRRKMINPSFHFRLIMDFFPMINEKVDILLELLDEKVEGKGALNVDAYFYNLSLDVVCQSVLGVNVNAQRNPEAEFVTAIREIGDIFFTRIYTPWLWPSWLFYWTSYRKRQEKYTGIIRDFSWKVIQERQGFLDESKLKQNGLHESGQDEEKVYGKKNHRVTMDTLLESTCNGKKLTANDVVDEVTIQIFAGHETAASAMTFCLFLLGLHPKVQEMLQEELDQVLGESDRALTFDDLRNLKYLEAVMKESYRLYPPAPFIGRELPHDIVIDGHLIPANTTLGICISTTHRDSKVFPNPDKFDPERFLGPSPNTPTAYEFIPFSSGPRNCIGSKMGQIESKLVIARMLLKYDVISYDKPEDLKLAGPILRSFHGIRLSIKRRN